MAKYWVYMMSNVNRNVLYIGVTNDLQRRYAEHREAETPGFTATYRCCDLVYFDDFQDIEAAIAREKQLKGWCRKKKNQLIAQMNPNFENLGVDL